MTEELKECGNCGYPLTADERAGMHELNGKLWFAGINESIKDILAAQWISVEDGLPDIGVNVLVRLSVADRFNVTEAIRFSDGSWVDCWAARLKGYPVKHWQPLPAPPIEVIE